MRRVILFFVSRGWLKTLAHWSPCVKKVTDIPQVKSSETFKVCSDL